MSSTEQPPKPRARILVVDDERGIRALCSDILRRAGHEVEVADNGTAGLAAARAHRFDLIFCDINLPGVDGLSMLPSLLAREDEARSLLSEAEKTIRVLEAEGILPRELSLGWGQLYPGTSRVEDLYYRMFQFHNVYTWKGAHHFSADFAHWYGWAHLQMSLIEIKEEARKLREMAKNKR